MPGSGAHSWRESSAGARWAAAGLVAAGLPRDHRGAHGGTPLPRRPRRRRGVRPKPACAGEGEGEGDALSREIERRGPGRHRRGGMEFGARDA